MGRCPLPIHNLDTCRSTFLGSPDQLELLSGRPGEIRERFDGARRNPFDEPECGKHYARSMASWSAVIALSEFNYSRVDKKFSITGKPGKWFWSNGSAWGTVTVAQDRATIEIIEGSLEIDSFFCGGRKFKKLKNVPYTYTKG